LGKLLNKLKKTRIVSDSVVTPQIVLFSVMFLALICVDFYARGLHTRTAVARVP